jgi:pantetheine-phosphate adenylyltransferase
LAKRKSPIIAIYPGSFDPITLGHLDIIKRAVKLFDKLIVAVADPLHKNPLLSIETRIKLVKESVKGIDKVEVKKLEGLLVEFARKHEASAIIRGLRAVSDFEYEFKMAWMNRRLCPEIETIFLIPSEEYAYLASSLVKEIAFLGGDIKSLVPAPVVDELLKVVKKIGDFKKSHEGL